MNYRRPGEGEYNSYYQGYIDQTGSNDFLSELKNALPNTITFLENLPAEKWDFKYAPEKWTIKEVMLHIIDTERVFAYRAMRVARNDKTPMPGFEQDDYVPNSNASQRSASSVIEEYAALRNSTIQLFQNFSEDQLNRIGTASGFPISTLALGFILAGHEAHHMRIIREKYL